MNLLKIAIAAVCLLCTAAATAPTTEAATNFNGSTIIGIDQAERTITFRTKDGEKWTLPIDPDLLKKEQISQGDQVSIELDTNDRVTKILKPSEQAGAAQTGAREDGTQ